MIEMFKSSGFPILNVFDTTHGGGTCGGEPCPDGFLVANGPVLSGDGLPAVQYVPERERG